MEREARLIWKGSCGMFDRPVRHLTMDYEHCHALDEKEARRILVYAVESLLADLNKGYWGHPQLSHSPFMPEDLTIEVYFNSFFSRFVDTTRVKFIRLEKGLVSFEAYNTCGPRGFWTREERYKDSVFHVLCALEHECLCSTEENARDRGYGVARSMKWEDNPLHERLQNRVTKRMPSSFQRYPALVCGCDEEQEKEQAQREFPLPR
jgi:hypothetical protein